MQDGDFTLVLPSGIISPRADLPGSSDMARLESVGVICLLVAIVVAACAPMSPTRQMTPQGIDSLAKDFAASRIEEWGLVKGSPREAKLHSLAVQLLSNEAFQVAARHKPMEESWEDWGARLVNEGAMYLPDDSLHRAAEAKARMLNEATDAECMAFARLLASGVNGPGSFAAALGQKVGIDSDATSRAVWRQRLARVSEQDFDALMQAEFDATLARARRVNDPPMRLTSSEKDRAWKSLDPHFPKSLSSTRVAELLDKAETGDPIALCAVARIISTAQSRVSGQDAGLALRFFFSGGN